MKMVYDGKTKTVFALDNGQYLLKFKDTATGNDGVFDPGANTVGLTIDGMGSQLLKMSTYFFQQLESKGYQTQYVSSDLSENTMTILPCESFGQGLEVICRFKATGSFVRRYGKYIKDGEPLDALIEMTIKDDDRNDPLANSDTLVQLGICTVEEVEKIETLCKEISIVIQQDLKEKGLELFDIKLEFGRYKNEILLIDEVSSGNMRVYRDGTILDPLELAKYYA